MPQRTARRRRIPLERSSLFPGVRRNLSLPEFLKLAAEAQSQRKEWLDADVDEYDIIFTEDFDDSDEEIEIEV